MVDPLHPENNKNNGENNMDEKWENSAFYGGYGGAWGRNNGEFANASTIQHQVQTNGDRTRDGLDEVSSKFINAENDRRFAFTNKNITDAEFRQIDRSSLSDLNAKMDLGFAASAKCCCEVKEAIAKSYADLSLQNCQNTGAIISEIKENKATMFAIQNSELKDKLDVERSKHHHGRG